MFDYRIVSMAESPHSRNSSKPVYRLVRPRARYKPKIIKHPKPVIILWYHDLKIFGPILSLIKADCS